MRKFGTEYAGFYYPASLHTLTSDSILYCVGVGEDISHDVELARALDARVYLFDPTPRAIAHASLVRSVMDDPSKAVHSPSFGGGDVRYWETILKNRIDPDRIVLTPCGVYSKNAMMRFYKPTNPSYVSCSVVPGMKSSVSEYDVPVKTLRTLMTELHHDRIDLLKLDVEGAECDVIDSMLSDAIYPHFLAVDFDLGWHGEHIRDMDRCASTIRKLGTHGYRLIRSDGSNYSFEREKIKK